MENQLPIYLNVKTVPAFDPVKLCQHTAYTVFLLEDNNLMYASGWTLRDAIEYFADRYRCDRSDIRLKRPFSRQ